MLSRAVRYEQEGKEPYCIEKSLWSSRYIDKNI
jgi:hypothetical protein